VVLIGGAIAVGGPGVFSRLLGTTNTDDPTTGRTHFWSVTLDVIKAYPIVGSGLGSFSVIYTRYDSRNGLYRLEQAHNDYLQRWLTEASWAASWAHFSSDSFW